MLIKYDYFFSAIREFKKRLAKILKKIKCGLVVGGVCLNHQVELALKSACKGVSKLN